MRDWDNWEKCYQKNEKKGEIIAKEIYPCD